jgi:hypothetical protein
MKSLKQIREASGGKEAYQKFFNSLLKKFGVSSPSELEGSKKKDFFDAIDKGWDGDNEPKEKGESVKEAKKLKGGRGKAELDINWDGDAKDVKFASTKYKVKIKPHRDGAMISGDKQKILAYLLGQDYGMDPEDIEDLYPEVLESSDDFKSDEDESDDKGNYSGVEESLEKPKAQPVTKDTEAEAGGLKRLSEIREGFFGKSYPVMDAGQRGQVIKIAKKWSGNMARALMDIEKIRAGLTDNPDVMDILRAANEEVSEVKMVQGNKKEYWKRIEAVMKKFGIKSVTELKPGDRKKYFAAVDKALGHSLESVSEAKMTVDVDYDDNEVDKKKHMKLMKKHKVKITKSVWDHGAYRAKVTGDEKNIRAWMSEPGHYDQDYIDDTFESVQEAVDCDGRLLGFKAATRRKEGEKQKGSVLVDRRTTSYKEAQIRREKAQAKREEKRKQEEFAKKYPKLEYNKNSDEENEALMKKINKNFVPETAANAAGSGSGVDMAPNAGKKKKDKFKVVKRANY